jgi:DNA-directed RNA polymerase subunit RPC12/RpoP
MKCINCKKELNKKAKYYGTIRCKSCSMIHLFKDHKHPTYKNGKFKRNKIYKCIKCNKKITQNTGVYGQKMCQSCIFKQRIKQKGHPSLGHKGVNGKMIIKHHIDLDNKNNLKANILWITQSLHTSLHHKAYNYLVKKRLVRNYIKWFLKHFK